MIGIILCCHGDMAEGVKSAAELIIGPQENFVSLGIHLGEGMDALKKQLKSAIRKAGKEGVLILTDIPGGTPFNVSAMMIGDRVKMISGFNLPMVIKLLMDRHGKTGLDHLVEGAARYGAEHVLDVSDMMAKGAGDKA
jgi:mannose/fructose/sorbose-specific phosphotransferase system IIA component